MSDPLIKIFNQLYVGFQPRTRRVEDAAGQTKFDPIKLAFVTPYENTAAGQKRIATVEQWAVTQGRWVQKSDGSGQEYLREPKADEFKSVIIENLPTAGFKLAEEVRRTYWGGGNVVWRIESPLGWEFEISSSNLARIITDCGIAAGGEILGRCIFGRMGKDNILIPEGSELWERSIKDAETLEARSKVLSAKAVVPGSTCTMKNSETMTYLGKFYVTELNTIYKERSRSYSVRPYTISSTNLDYLDDTLCKTFENVYHVFKSTNVCYPERFSINCYREKRVIEITGTDPDYADQKVNEAKLNKPGVYVNYASSSKNSYSIISQVFSIDKPTSAKCLLTPISTEEVDRMVRPGKYSWPILYLKIDPEDTQVGSDCTVLTGNGVVIDSMLLFGLRVPRDPNDPNKQNYWEFKRDSIKVVFEEKISIDPAGNITKHRNALRNNIFRHNGVTYDPITMNNPSVGVGDNTEIAKQAVQELLATKGPFNLLTFLVTTSSGEALQAQVK